MGTSASSLTHTVYTHICIYTPPGHESFLLGRVLPVPPSLVQVTFVVTDPGPLLWNSIRHAGHTKQTFKWAPHHRDMLLFAIPREKPLSFIPADVSIHLISFIHSSKKWINLSCFASAPAAPCRTTSPRSRGTRSGGTRSGALRPQRSKSKHMGLMPS